MNDAHSLCIERALRAYSELNEVPMKGDAQRLFAEARVGPP